MKYCFYFIRIMALCVIISILAGCFSTKMMYDGSPLPKEEVGILYLWSKVSKLEIIEVDGKKPDIKINPWVDQRDCQIHLLPGEHNILVGLRTGWLGVSGEGQVLLNFVAEAGHIYSLNKEKTGYEIGKVIYIPYIVDNNTKEKVSNIITDSNK